MGYWKDVDLAMQEGCTREQAERLVAQERYGNTKADRDAATEKLSKIALDKQIDEMLASMR